MLCNLRSVRSVLLFCNSKTKWRLLQPAPSPVGGSDPSQCWQLSCCGVTALNWLQSGFKYDLWALFTKALN